jgi:membrane-bound lytic murein transglycosylase B
MFLLPLIFLSLSLSAMPASAQLSQTPAVAQFIQQMVDKHRFEKARLIELFDQVKPRPQVIESVKNPAEKTLTWARYRSIFLQEKRIQQGQDFMRTHWQTLQKAQNQTGVPASLITAILGVETWYGRLQGEHPVIEALVSLSFNGAPREAFFRSELEQFLLMTREQKLPPLQVKGSYAGAMGMGQFISSSYRNFAVDFDGDGQKDLFHSTEDAIGSVANYLAKNGWRAGQAIYTPIPYQKAWRDLKARNRVGTADLIPLEKLSPLPLGTEFFSAKAMLMDFEGPNGPEMFLGEHNFFVITRYNQSPLYALAVAQLAEAIKADLQP